MPMIYIDDCLRGTLELLECPEDKLERRTYNMQGISFTAEQLVENVQQFLPDLEVEYEVDSLRQSIGKCLAARGKGGTVSYCAFSFYNVVSSDFQLSLLQQTILIYPKQCNYSTSPYFFFS